MKMLHIVNTVVTASSGFLSLFILIVTLLHWIKNKRLPVTNQLIFGLSFFSVVHHFPQNVYDISSIFNIDTIIQFINKVFMPISFFVMSACNPCFCTCLCVHFCLKIVKIDHQFYVILQRRFHDLIPWILVSSVLGSLPISIPLAFGIRKRVSSNKTLDDFIQMPPLTRSAEFIAYATVTTAGFLLCSVSALTIVFSLLRHIINLRRNSQWSKSSSIKSHVKAATTVFLLLAANDLSLIFILIPILQIDKMQWILISMTAYSLLQCLSFLNLIAGNAILNKALRDVLKTCLCSSTSNNSP